MTLEESGMFLSVAQIFDDQPELSYAATEREISTSRRCAGGVTRPSVFGPARADESAQNTTQQSQ